jgi:hypothetical protein
MTIQSGSSEAAVPEDLASKAWPAIDRGERVEIAEDLFNDWLDMLPPVFVNCGVELITGERVRASFGFAEGADPVIACWYTTTDGKRQFFAQKTKLHGRG